MICHSCSNWRVIITLPPAQFTIFGCPVNKFRFGQEKDFVVGKFLGNAQEKREGKISDMPKKCAKYEPKL